MTDARDCPAVAQEICSFLLPGRDSLVGDGPAGFVRFSDEPGSGVLGLDWRLPSPEVKFNPDLGPPSPVTNPINNGLVPGRAG